MGFGFAMEILFEMRDRLSMIKPIHIGLYKEPFCETYQNDKGRV